MPGKSLNQALRSSKVVENPVESRRKLIVGADKFRHVLFVTSVPEEKFQSDLVLVEFVNSVFDIERALVRC